MTIHCYNHITYEQYRLLPAISQTDLKKAFENPQLYYEQRIAKTRPADPETPSQKWGKRMEAWLRGFRGIDVVVIPAEVLNEQGHRKGKAWNDFAEANEGKELLKYSEWKEMYGGFESAEINVEEHDAAYQLVYSEHRKWSQRYVWDDEEFGLQLKCEIDIMDVELGSLVDVKTAADITPRGFESDLIGWGYDIQAAMYLRAASLAHPNIDWLYSWVVICNKPPYHVEVYQASNALLDLGEQRLRYRAEAYKECVETGRWRTPTHGIVNEVYPPKWAMELV